MDSGYLLHGCFFQKVYCERCNNTFVIYGDSPEEVYCPNCNHRINLREQSVDPDDCDF